MLITMFLQGSTVMFNFGQIFINFDTDKTLNKIIVYKQKLVFSRFVCNKSKIAFFNTRPKYKIIGIIAAECYLLHDFALFSIR